MMALSLVYFLLIYVFDLHISYYGSKYIIDSIVLTLIGLLLIYYVSCFLIPNSHFLLFVGRNTLFYFAFHGKVYSLLETILHHIIPIEAITSNQGLQFIVAFLIVILDAAILIIPAIIVNKYLPFLLGKRFKLWKT